MRALSALVLYFAFCGVARAQETPQSAPRALVQYTIETVLRTESAHPYNHPLLVRLLNEMPLATLNAEDFGSGLKVRAVLTFGSLEAFRTWYASDETKALMQDLSQEPDISVKTQLAMQRVPSEIAR